MSRGNRRELKTIEVFYAIMQAGTVSGAARLLHVSQPMSLEFSPIQSNNWASLYLNA